MKKKMLFTWLRIHIIVWIILYVVSSIFNFIFGRFFSMDGFFLFLIRWFFSSFFYSFVISLPITLDVFLALQFEEVAELKGYSDRKYFWISVFLGIIGYLLVSALPDRNVITGGNRSVSAAAQGQPYQARSMSLAKPVQPMDEKRLAYWVNHKEEHQALLQRKVEVARKLNSTTLSAVERNALQKTLSEIENELNRAR